MMLRKFVPIVTPKYGIASGKSRREQVLTWDRVLFEELCFE